MRTRGFAAAALAASLLLVVPGAGPVQAASSGVVPAGRPAWVTLAKPVAVVGVGAAGTGEVAVAEGASGFPVVVTTSGAAGGAGSVPGGDCVAVEVHGQQVGHGRAGAHGRFAVAGPVPAGAVATIRWAPCTDQTTRPSQHDCHNRTPHAGNQNRDEAHSDGQGCSTAGDDGPRS